MPGDRWPRAPAGEQRRFLNSEQMGGEGRVREVVLRRLAELAEAVVARNPRLYLVESPYARECIAKGLGGVSRGLAHIAGARGVANGSNVAVVDEAAA